MFSKKNKNVLKFISPAKSFSQKWREGLLTGNGKIGLNVLGNAGREVIIVNHADLFWEGKTGVLPDVSDKKKNIIKNLKESNYREAETTLTDALIGKNYKPECEYPLPLCDFIFTTELDGNIYDYYRQVNLDTSEVQVEYKIKNVKYNRNIFVSKQNNYICFELYSSKKISGCFNIEMHDKSNNRMPNYESFDLNFACETKTDKDFMIFTCRNTDGTDFGCVARVFCPGGSLNKENGKMNIKNADRIFIIAKTFVLSQKEVEVEKIKEELSLLKTSYEKLLKDHSAYYSKLMSTTEFSLNCQSYESVEGALFEMQKYSFVPQWLLEKLYQYGKHLFICSYDGKILPCGLFNGDYKAYRSTTENFVQLQRMCNFTFKSDLVRNLKPLFEKFYDNLDDYKKNSTRLFGCKGIFVPSLEAPESGLPGSVMPGVVMNYNVACYISTMIFEYFLLTDDKEFMDEKGFEFIYETGSFYEDLFVLNKEKNIFEIPFGFSPYNTPSNIGVSGKCNIASNCVCDFQCAKQVFSMLNQLCLLLDKDGKEVDKWAKMLEKIPDLEVDKEGFLKEYIGNAYETNNSSPYIPYLFPYNIGLKPFDAKPDYDELVSNSIKLRYSNCFGKFSSSNLLDLSLALSSSSDSSNSYEVLSTLLKNFMTNNLTISSGDNVGMGVGAYEPWTSFNIDKNIGLCSCIQNMFINSTRNNIFLFKSLPEDLSKGYLNNLILDNQIKVDIEFNVKKGFAKLKLKSNKNMSLNIFFPKNLKKVKGIDKSLIDSQFNCLKNMSLQANKNCLLKIYFKNET